MDTNTNKNPIASVVEFFRLGECGPQDFKMYQSLCMEESAEWMDEIQVIDQPTGTVDMTQQVFVRALDGYSRTLRQFDELHVVTKDPNALLDAHLDCVWVHLGAALALLNGEPEKLAEAWARLHHANVMGKLQRLVNEDGTPSQTFGFVRDATGKITKPEGWKAPEYHDLFEGQV